VGGVGAALASMTGEYSSHGWQSTNKARLSRPAVAADHS